MYIFQKIYNEAKVIGANDVSDMLDNIWKVIIESASIEREVIVEGDNVAWSAEVPNISINQVEKFAQIFDIVGKRNYNPVNISSDLLAYLRNKEIHVHVFTYSRNVATNGTFNVVKKNLLDPVVRDRSAAVANQVIEEIIDKLKTSHSHHLISPQPIGWRIWASFIATKPPASHDQLIMDGPPDHIVMMFRNIPTSEAEILSNAKQGLRIARNVSGIQRASLGEIREHVEGIKSTIELCLQQLGGLTKHLDYLEKQSEREESLLRDMDNAITPEESVYSTAVANLVTDCEDMDHQ